MILARVRNRVVSHSKLDRIPERSLLSVVPLEGYGDPDRPMIAIDSVQAGPGDLVIVMQEGTGAREALELSTPLPLQTVIVGIVDQIEESVI